MLTQSRPAARAPARAQPSPPRAARAGVRSALPHVRHAIGPSCAREFGSATEAVPARFGTQGSAFKLVCQHARIRRRSRSPEGAENLMRSGRDPAAEARTWSDFCFRRSGGDRDARLLWSLDSLRRVDCLHAETRFPPRRGEVAGAVGGRRPTASADAERRDPPSAWLAWGVGSLLAEDRSEPHAR
jgi:hypothetical protein